MPLYDSTYSGRFPQIKTKKQTQMRFSFSPEQSMQPEIFSSSNASSTVYLKSLTSDQLRKSISDEKDDVDASKLNVSFSQSPQTSSSGEKTRQSQILTNGTAHKIVPVYLCGTEKQFKTLNMANRLRLTTDPHLEEVIWLVQAASLHKVIPFVNESMRLRIEREYNSNSNHTDLDIDFSTIDPKWKIFFFEFSDFGGAKWAFELMNQTLVPLVGWKRLHFVTRTAQTDRKMDYWASLRWRLKKSNLYNETISNSTINQTTNYERFDDFLGEKINFTKYLGVSFGSVQKMSMETRLDIENKIQRYIKEEGKRSNISDSLSMDERVVHGRDRPTDIRTFWNSRMCEGGVACKFRNYVSDFLNSTFSQTNVSVNIDQVGFMKRKGRKKVHDAYAHALLTTKIIVLAQRDNWEDHYRTMESLLGGALVFVDPQLYFPEYVEDGVNVIVYHSFEELRRKLIYYLDHPAERFDIARRGRQLALTHHFRHQQAENLLLAMDDDNRTYVNEYGLTRLHFC